MVSKERLQGLATRLQGLAGKITLCGDVARALVETGQEWDSVVEPQLDRMLTDFGRSRQEMLSAAQMALGEMFEIRRELLSVDVIRASAYVTKIIEECQGCPRSNRSRIDAGQPFACAVLKRLESHMENPFRFSLNEKGQIVEHK